MPRSLEHEFGCDDLGFSFSSDGGCAYILILLTVVAEESSAGMKTLETVSADGLYVDDVGPWAEEKYLLVAAYASTFTRAMRAKYPSLIYIDMFAGPGRVRIRGTPRIHNSSPLIALSIDPPFDRLIFCEEDADRLNALKKRCQAEYPSRDVRFLPGDVNDNAGKILNEMPQHRKDHGVLSLCFVDPYMMSDLRFGTLELLAQRWVDFLVLIPDEMDAQRNEDRYVSEGNNTVAQFVGNPDWRPAWFAARARGVRFGHFVIEEFGRSMERLGRKLDPSETWRVRNTVNRDLYHLGLYSRKELGRRFWREVRKYAKPNLDFGF